MKLWMTSRLADYRLGFVLIAIVAAAIGCGPATSSATAPSLQPGEQPITIETNTQALVGGDLRIGAGNFREEDYTAPDGQTKHGPTAALWFSTSEAPADPPMARVHPGWTMTVRGVALRVIEVDADSVFLAVRPGP